MDFLTFIFANSKILTGLSFAFAFLFSCNPVSTKNNINPSHKTEENQCFALNKPANDFITKLDKSILFEIQSLQKDKIADSVEIYLEGLKVFTNRGPELTFTGTSIFKKTGRENIRLKIFYNDSLNQVLTCRITILSDKIPSELHYKVIRSIPHDPTSYVQGLIYYKGLIYEGSGLPSRSKLKKIDPENGATLYEIKLDDEFFGEGITLLNDKIYQLTYKSKVGFIYDAKSFELIRKFDLQTVEGWGLTNDNKNLISSDGSSVLYYYDPEYLTQVGQTDVCDQNGLVTSLNELEFYKGVIWANIYGQKIIVKIDAETGKIIGKLDLDHLFPKNIADDIDHVLNGIAFNSETNTYYITGKLWPVMYEIEIFD
jgi:glutaminyl-peptide cyclotransferase